MQIHKVGNKQSVYTRFFHGYRNPKAQSLVEFALILPILILLVMGTFDLGRLFYIKIALESAAREGAYYLSYNPNDITSYCAGVPCVYPLTLQAIQFEANNMGVQVGAANVVVTGTAYPPTTSSTIAVSVNQTVNLLIFNFISGPVNISSTVRMLVQ